MLGRQFGPLWLAGGAREGQTENSLCGGSPLRYFLGLRREQARRNFIRDPSRGFRTSMAAQRTSGTAERLHQRLPPPSHSLGEKERQECLGTGPGPFSQPP